MIARSTHTQPTRRDRNSSLLVIYLPSCVRAFAFMTLTIFVLASTVCPVFGTADTPCTGVDTSLTESRAMQLAWLVDAHLKVPYPPVKSIGVFAATAQIDVRVLKYFRMDGWTIVQEGNNESEIVYLFYRHDPEDGKFIDGWGGSVRHDLDVKEAERELVSWVREEMPDIPQKLATCFAEHAVEGQTR